MSDVKVKDLIEQLQQLDPELPVLVQTDPEGNGFFWASGADTNAFIVADDLKRDRTDSVWSEQDIADEGDVEENYVRVCIVYP